MTFCTTCLFGSCKSESKNSTFLLTQPFDGEICVVFFFLSMNVTPKKPLMMQPKKIDAAQCCCDCLFAVGCIHRVNQFRMAQKLCCKYAERVLAYPVSMNSFFILVRIVSKQHIHSTHIHTHTWTSCMSSYFNPISLNIHFGFCVHRVSDFFHSIHFTWCIHSYALILSFETNLPSGQTQMFQKQ